MFVGHAALAFALVGGVAVARGRTAERALALGVVAGAFAALPDVDMLYALVGIAGAVGGDALAVAGAFWSTGNVVHRAVTHSLVLAPPVALLAALHAADARSARALSVTLGLALVAVVGVGGGALAALVTLAFVLGAAVVGTVAGRYAALTPLQVLAADPTLHLLGVFGVELATVWAAVAVVCLATGLRPTAAVSPRATLGAGYAASVLLIPAPTLDLSYPFVFSVLGVGLLGLFPRVHLVGDPRGPTVEPLDWLGAALTGLSAITVAWLAYTVAYVLVG